MFLAGILLVITTIAVSAAQNGPSFDCAKASPKRPLEPFICADARLWPIERAFDAAYQDVRRRLPPDQRQMLKADDLRFIVNTVQTCGIDKPIPDVEAAPEIEEEKAKCVAERFQLQTGVWSQQIQAASAGTLYANHSPLITLLPASKTPTETVLTQSQPNTLTESVPLVESAGVYNIPVFINGVGPFPFVLDSGAADVSITVDVLLTLMRIGSITQNDYISTAEYQLGDGTTVQSDKFFLHELKVGSRVLKHVAASVSKDVKSPLLLGQSFLKRLTSVAIDNDQHTIVLGPERANAADMEAGSPAPDLLSSGHNVAPVGPVASPAPKPGPPRVDLPSSPPPPHTHSAEGSLPAARDINIRDMVSSKGECRMELVKGAGYNRCNDGVIYMLFKNGRHALMFRKQRRRDSRRRCW